MLLFTGMCFAQEIKFNDFQTKENSLEEKKSGKELITDENLNVNAKEGAPVEIYTQLCENFTSTNPLLPKNPKFPNFLNRFNWQNNAPIPYNTPILNNTFTPNPFFSNQPEFQNIALQEDYKSENGWEALAYNLGYDNNNILLLAPPQHSYFLLYNKYRGILRVMLKWSGVPSTFNQSLLTIQFSSGFQTNLLDMTTYEKPLLAPHIPNPKYTTSLKFFNGVDNWSYADFKVNYDPCTCNFSENSRLLLKTNLIQNSTISLSGSINGTITTITNGVVSGTDGSSGKFWNDVNGANKTFTTFHEGANSFVTKYQSIYNTLNDNGIKLQAIQNLGNFMSTNSFMKAGLKAAPFVSTAVSFISSLFAGGAGATGPQALQPLSVDLSVKLNGNITYNADMHNFTVGLPGSQNSGVLTGVNGGQPLYNEPLGVFSLIDEPTMYYNEVNVWEPEEIVYYYSKPNGLAINPPCYPYNCPYQLLKSNGWTNKFRFTLRNYKLDGNVLRYVINPASKLVLQDAQIVYIAEYEKPAIGLSENFPAAFNNGDGAGFILMNPNIDVNKSNGLSIPGFPYVGNNINQSNNLFQSASVALGHKNFNNDYSFSYLHNVTKIADSGRLFNFGVESISNFAIIGPVYNPSMLKQYVTPKPEYLQARIKTFKMQLILNLKRTDNPAAQNVLYVVTYPIKTLPAPEGFNMTGRSMINDVNDYNNGINANANKLVPFSGDLTSLCNSAAYRNSRNQQVVSNRNSLGAVDNNNFFDQNLIADSKIQIAPNPVKDLLNVKLNNCKLINLISLDGRVLKSFNKNDNLNNEEIEIDFKDFSKGIYIINYENVAGKLLSAKIIKE